jgi:4-amino-4-deoxy-L-arabinose transferase-like glycosyltransferase
VGPEDRRAGADRVTGSGRRLAAVLALAAAVRLAVFFAFPDVFDFVRTGRIHGSGAYDGYATNLLDTGVYGWMPGVPDAALPPLYSVALAAVYGALGRGALQVALFHVALDVVSIALLVDIGRRLLPRGEAAGLLAGLATALYPYLVFQTLTVIDTPLFMALLHAFVWLVVVLREREPTAAGTWALAALGGLALGLGMLTRPVFPPLAGLVAVWFGWRRSARQTASRLALAALVGLVVVGAWAVRNQHVCGAFVLTTNAGSNFWQGNNPATVALLRAGYDAQWAPSPLALASADWRSPETDAELFRLARRYLLDHPGAIVELAWVKLLVHWSLDVAPRRNPMDVPGSPSADAAGRVPVPTVPPGDPVGRYSQPLFDRVGRTLHVLSWGPLLFLGLLGALLTAREWRDVSLLWFVQLAMTLVYVVTHPSTRYRAPSDPLLFLLSGAALVWLADRASRWRRR